tara:strand:+ start:3961 stop:5241 length:1281 start_codon:yes stop_codon:yes gene_type:complete
VSIKIYKDLEANSIFIEDANGAQFVNSLQATVPVDKVTIVDLARQIEIVSEVVHSDFVDKDDNPYTGSEIDVCNTLNAMFSSAGTPTSEAPTITSSLSVSLTQGETLNYELTANLGVGYEWDLSSVTGVTTVEGNPRKLIGGTSLVEGSYSIPVKAINYNGEDSSILTLTVASPPFANTKSTKFENQDYLGANAALLGNVLGRTGNGSGTSDAWSISFWYNTSTSSAAQTILYYGDSTTSNGGHILLQQVNVSGTKQLRFRYGHQYNRIQLQATGLAPNTWQHVLITYDGGTTGSQSTQINDYYGRFNIFIDGVLASTSNSHAAFGYNAGIQSDVFRVGRYSSGNYMRNCKVDELAVFDSDQSSSISEIHNGGAPKDLSTLTTQPNHWWRMGDGDTYPYLQDSGSAANCVLQMYNMTSANIINDVP